MLFHEVLPPKVASDFAAFLAELREAPRLLPAAAVQSITDAFPSLAVHAVQLSSIEPTVLSHEWNMRYVTMPQVTGMSSKILSKFVIDTGAIVNCMSLDYYTRYAPLLEASGSRAVQPTLDPTTDIVAVDSSPLAIQTIVMDVPFTLGGRKFVSHFLLVSGLVATPFLLGGPWLATSKCDIHYSSQMLVLPPTDSHKRCELPFVVRDQRIARTGTYCAPFVNTDGL
jgi:hypothetical protein